MYRLENKSNDSFTPGVAIGTFVKAVANSIRGEKSLICQYLEDAWIKEKVGTSDNGLQKSVKYSDGSQVHLHMMSRRL